jgi:hypothetical protein
MTTFNPLSVRNFVGYSQLQRKTRARFRVATGILLSLLLHAALLLYALMAPPTKPVGADSPVSAPLMVTLLPNKPKPPSTVAPSPTPPAPKSSPTIPRPQPRAASKPRNVAKPTPRQPVARPAAPPVPESANAMRPPPAPDMSSMLDAARARRQADNAASTDEALSHDKRAPSGNEIAQANIDFSLNRHKGVSGVFQIISIGPRVGQFLFVGWTTDASNSTRQTISVDAGMDGDVRKAMIDRMIELIRTHYKENFNWDSQRLGRVVVLSARDADRADLRRFMMSEFFDKDGNWR